MHGQDRILAFLMGTHARLGAGSPVLLLDATMASLLAENVAGAHRWCVQYPHFECEECDRVMLLTCAASVLCVCVCVCVCAAPASRVLKLWLS